MDFPVWSKSAGRSKFGKKLESVFGHAYWFNSTEICLGATLKVRIQHSIN